jgi:hypothetical protein
MRASRIAAAASLLLATGQGCLNAQGKPQDSVTIAATVRESRASATAGLDTLRTLARTNYRAVGFTTPTEAEGAALGEPFVVFFVRLDALRAFVETTDPNTLLSGGDQVIYPVMVAGAARSSVGLARTRAAWRPTAYGGANATSAYVRTRAAAANTAKISESAYFVVRVPALQLAFLGSRSGATLMLTPVADDLRGRWKAGATMPARDVLRQLVADAKASNGLPG